MCWRKRKLLKAGIVVAGMLLLLVLMTWVPVSAARAYEGVSKLAMPGTITVQTTPTEDATVTALNKEKLAQEVQQLKEQNEPDFFGWFRMNASILLSTLVVVIGGLIGLWRWLGDRRSEREKRAEERFQAAVTGLGDDREGARVGAAILLRIFLRPGYEQFYTQAFDLAVANLRLRHLDPNTPEPLTSLSQALIIVFKESFPLARKGLRLSPQFLDASCIQLDNAHLADADLQQMWLPEASLRNAALRRANLSSASLYKANLSQADLKEAILTKANLYKANLRSTDLSRANLAGADLRGANLKQADLSQADLRGANLTEADLRGANLGQDHLMGTILTGADLRGCGWGSLISDDVPDSQRVQRYIDLNPDESVPSDLQGEVARYVNKVTLAFIELCKEKGAIIAPNTDAYIPDISPRSNDVQASSAPSIQESIPIPDTNGGSTASSQHNPRS